jgi:hypothetical protein
MNSFETPRPGAELRAATAASKIFSSHDQAVEHVNSRDVGPSNVMVEEPNTPCNVLRFPPSEERSMYIADASLSTSSSSSSIPGPDLSAFLGNSSPSAPAELVKDVNVSEFLRFPPKNVKTGFKLSMRPLHATGDHVFLFETDSTFFPTTYSSPVVYHASEDISNGDRVPRKSSDAGSLETRRDKYGLPRTSLKRRSPARANQRASRFRIQLASNERVFLPQF